VHDYCISFNSVTIFLEDKQHLACNSSYKDSYYFKEKKTIMNTRKLFFSLVVFFLAVPLVQGQAVSDKRAEELIYSGNIIAASKAFETKVQSDPSNPDYRLKLGYCYMNMPNNKENAIAPLQKALELYTEQENERGAFDAKYQLARTYRKNLRFGEALVLFNELKIESDRKDYEAIDILQREIDYCENAKSLLNVENPIQVRNFGEPINSNFSEHSPFLSYSEDLMVFTSRRKYQTEEQQLDGQYDEDVYMTTKDGQGHWVNPQPLGNRINTSQNDANCGLSADGQKIYIYRGGDIYESERDGDKWTRIAKLGKYVNSSHREVHLFVSKDGNTIFFSSDMPEGYGGTDIYRITKEGEKWSDPQNAGPAINTPYDDDSPFLHENGIFYFSSKGHNSIGGFDIFSAEISGSSFRNVKNLGFPVNSVEDDIHYFLSDDTQRAYFASRRSGGFGRSDIYFIDFTDTINYYVTVKGVINTPPAIGAKPTVTVYEESTKSLYKTVFTDTSSTFRILSKRGESYFVHVQAQGTYFEAFSYPAPIDNVMEYNLTEKELTPVQQAYVNKKYLIIFESGSNKLSNASELLLNMTAQFLKQNPSLELDLSSLDDEDDRRSKKRIQEITDYLKSKGISESKINIGIELANPKNENQILMTLIDEPMKEFLVSGQIAGTDEINTDEVPSDESGRVYVPNDNQALSSNAVFTIVLGDYNKSRAEEQDFLSRFQGQVKKTETSGGKTQYTFGQYTQKTLAEDNLVMIKKMGYPNAKVAELNN
jgi:tetratricopeptide (TPR) repeat protein/outer membrane protein OmpA-like peptidoglycan-associated protein